MASPAIPQNAHIETIDFGPFATISAVPSSPSELSSQQRKVAQDINKSFRDNGFLFLTNFGLTDADIQEAFHFSKKLFSLPEHHKTKNLKPIDRVSNVGYVPLGLEALNRQRPADLKEAYNFKSKRVYDHDFQGCPDGFQEMAENFCKKIEQAALKLANACAIALNLPIDFFRKNMEISDLTTFRFLHYPPYTDFTSEMSNGNGKSALRVGEHTDFGIFTLLFTDGPGLQVSAIEGGSMGAIEGSEQERWTDVPMPDGPTAIVNTGALMARWTNDTWRATAHRVVVRDTEEASMDRYSIACFYEPDKGAVIEVDASFVAEGCEPKYAPINGYDHLQEKLRMAHGA